MLVDSGASHNFVSSKLVQQLQLPVSETPAFRVKLGDGYHISSIGMCKNLNLQLSQLLIEMDFYSFPLGGVDVILGMSWLETLGDLQANWKEMTIKFQVGKQQICLEGDSSFSREVVSIRSLRKTKEVMYSALLWPVETSVTVRSEDEQLDPLQKLALSQSIATSSKERRPLHSAAAWHSANLGSPIQIWPYSEG